MKQRIRYSYLFGFLFFLNGSYPQAGNLDSLLKRGITEIYEHPDEAIAIGKKVYGQAPEASNAQLKALMLISDAYSSKRDYRKSLEYVIRAKDFSQKTDDPLMQMQILTRTAVQYQQLRIYDKAIEYLDECSRIAMAYPEKDSIRYTMGNNFVIRGFIYKEQLNCDIAIGYFRQGIAEYESVKRSFINSNLSVAYYNIGNCQIKLSKLVEAKANFMISAAYAEKLDAKSLLAFAKKGHAEVLTLEGKYGGSIKILLEAKSISTGVGDLILNQGIYKGLSENYLALNDWPNYEKYHEDYLSIQLKIKESERKSISDSLNELAQTQNAAMARSKSEYVAGIVALAILSILLLIFIFRSNKKMGARFIALEERVKKLQTNQL
jgi:tetratricopeptide (TPR) repeat protein